MKSSDEALRSLLMKARKGDTEAFREIVEKTRDRMFGAVAAMVKREALAEEILQEAYMSLWDGNESGDVRNPAAWLYRFCSNRAIDHLRRNEPCFIEDLDEGFFPEEPCGPGPDILLQNREDSEKLSSALSKLAARERTVVIMSDYLGMNSYEIASALGSSPSTVRNQLAGGRRKLVVHMKGDNG